MVPQTEFSDELITKLTSIPELDLGGMIRNLPQQKPSTISRASNSSSLGRLDLLPPELLLEVLSLLDFQSLSRISRVSLMGKKTIEPLSSYRGPYCVRYRVKYHRSFRLVSIKQLLQLAIDVHGSAENVAKLKPEPGYGISPNDLYTLRQFHEAPLQPPGCDLSKLPSMPDRVNNKYPGMASIRMPTLTSSGLDYERLCRGCRYIYDQHSVGSLPASVLQELVPRGTGPTRPLLAILIRLRSGRGFIDHISQRYGARRLLQNWEEEQ
ncbi:hypothetical protein MRS44_009029 [Fusarium solani]|uniref:uncharacterized protein n=1 Tax=Fusarium solani TaxID=169388 RepID=UPI0032C4A0A3|nr:hypothetical protein MRS44_009029 [Fusarium solani]